MIFAAVVVPVMAVSARAGNGLISTIAGTGQPGYSGDSGAATAAKLNFPIRAVVARDGGILIADESNNVIRKIRTDGVIVTVAGVAGVGSFGGDGGAATKAHLNQPTGVAPLPNGGFLIADRSNRRIRMVTPAGIIQTVAGNGAACATPSGACGDGGAATSAQLNGPDRAVALADGSFFITEDQGNKVRKVSAAGVITRVAGNGVACANPKTACGDGHAATAANLNAPNGIALLPTGGFVISDSADNRVRKIDANGVITTIAGNGVAGSYGNGISATSANLNMPSSVSVAPDGSIVIADTYSHLVRAIKNGTITTLAGTADTPCGQPTNPCGDGGAATSAKLHTPYDASVTPDGFVLISDHEDHRIRRANTTLGGIPTIRVAQKNLVNGAGTIVELHGINRAIFESRCTYDSSGYADGPTTQVSVTAMLSWKIDVVRVSLNEDCWLGINGLPLSGDPAGYRAAVTTYVKLLRSNGLFVILENHMSAPGANKSTQIDYMPDASHMPTFWASVAGTFVADHGIIFDPINEVAMASYNNPHPSNNNQWACWRDGCTLDSVYGGRFVAAGLKTLIATIRSQGATQPILLGGLSYNGDLSQLLTYLPQDTANQLVASTHVYDFTAGSSIAQTFTNVLEPIAKKMPVILGELGERYCDSGTASYTHNLLFNLVDGERAKGFTFGALGWTWNAKTSTSTGWQCPTGPYGDGGPLLIRDYNGTPTVMGAVVKQWTQARSVGP